MQIIAHSISQFPLLDFSYVISNISKKHAIIITVALAALSTFVAAYCIIKSCIEEDWDDLDEYDDTLLNLDPLNSLQNYAKELADHVDKILKTLDHDDKKATSLRELRSFLIFTNHRAAIRDYCKITSKAEYKTTLYLSYNEAFKFLCELFKDKEFSIEKKIEILERLEKEKDQCIPGLAAALHDICNSVDEPVEMAEKLPWLVARYKTEVIKLIGNEVHHTNYLIIQYGVELGLPVSIIKAAQADLHVEEKSACDNIHFLKQYRDSLTIEGYLGFLESFINSDLPSRKAYQAYILSCLAEKLSDEQVDDSAIQASILAKHKAALENTIKREKAQHLIKFQGQADSVRNASWEKILKRIKLQENPFIDAVMYANYQYRLNPEDNEDHKLTSEAIKLFALDDLQSLHLLLMNSQDDEDFDDDAFK